MPHQELLSEMGCYVQDLEFEQYFSWFFFVWGEFQLGVSTAASSPQCGVGVPCPGGGH